jgi:hypothetical protein
MPRLVLLLVVRPEPNLVIHADPMDLGSDIDEWEIERVTVICRHDRGFAISNMFKPSSYQSGLNISTSSISDIPDLPRLPR